MWSLNHEETFISNYFSKEKFIPFLLLNFIKILIIYFRVRVSNSPLFFKSFQIRDDILIIGETSTHLNSYPIVLFEHRTFINWLKFYPSLRKFLSRCILVSLGFYSLIFQARDIGHTAVLRTKRKMIDESRVDESSIFNSTSDFVKSLTEWCLLWIWRGKRKDRIRGRWLRKYVCQYIAKERIE